MSFYLNNIVHLSGQTVRQRYPLLQPLVLLAEPKNAPFSPKKYEGGWLLG